MRKRRTKTQSSQAGTGTVQAGDIVARKPVTLLEPGKLRPPPMRGRVVWVHPLGRFHVVAFGEGAKTVRESFLGVDVGMKPDTEVI